MKRSPSDIKTERQLALAMLLGTSPRALTRAEIRAGVGEYHGLTDTAFERSFERDKKDLREIGMSLAVTEDFDGEPAYRLDRSAVELRPIELDQTERLALALAARAFASTGAGDSARNAIAKIEASSGIDLPLAGFVDVVPAPGSDLVEPLLRAIDDRQAIAFGYQKPGEALASQRVVDPWAVASLGGHWYLICRDRGRDAIRSFRLSRITGSPKRVGPANAFDPPTDLDPESVVQMTFGDRVDAVVRVVTGTGHAIRALGSVEADVPPWDRVDIAGVDSQRLIRTILRAGRFAVVDEPEWVREETYDKLRRVRSAGASLRPIDLAEAQFERPARASVGGANATARLARLLAVVPWLRSHPDATIASAAAHFGMDPKDLRQDLVLASCTEFGLNHTAMDISVRRGRVSIRDALGADEALRFSRTEVAALVLGLRALGGLAADGSPDVAARLETKLLQSSATPEVAVPPSGDQATLGGPSATAIEALRAGRAMRITYRSAARDAVSDRVIDPIRLELRDGAMYVAAWCRNAGAVRSFRLDRIQACEILDQPARPPARGTGPTDEPSECAILVVEPGAAWVGERARDAEVAALPDGRMAIRVPIASEAWVVSTVIALGGAAAILQPARLAALVEEEAAAAVAHYEPVNSNASAGVDLHAE